MYALLSVSDKEGIVSFAKGLCELGYEILSTGGTLKILKENALKAKDIATYTKSPELFEGRVKTLHPKIHGGILHKRDNPTHLKEAKENAIEAIDIVCVNLYPFKQTIEKTNDFDTIIENIDIGGPSLIRGSAKNFKDVLVITDKNDYPIVLQALQNQKNTLEFRREMMIKAFEHTAEYDCIIANYMNKNFHNNFGQKTFITGNKAFQTRYGENPHQKGAIYEFDSLYTDKLHILKGEPSFNNITDMHSAIKIATSFGDSPAVCIIKHNNPCGFALKENAFESYEFALKCDPISAYGGVVAINGIVDETLAKKINETFIEVLIAPHFTPEALKVFESKKRMKIFAFREDENSKTLACANDPFDFKHIQGGFAYQEADKISQEEVSNAQLMSQKGASKDQYKDLTIAYKIAALTKSNCVVYVKDCVLIAIGMGMTSRVDAARSALIKAKEMGLDTQGASLASEAFFPFRDSVDMAAQAGIAAIIEPGGSIRDDEVIESANQHQMALYFTGVRHFLH